MSDLPSPPAPYAPVLSVIVPLLNEEEVLPETYRQLKEHLDKLGISYEIVFVDDGSTDGSRAFLVAKSMEDPVVRLVSLSRNFGHEMATTAGLQHARGQAAVIIDADLQDPPEMIAEFIAKWREGYQVVYGVRARRDGETLLKKFTSFAFYRILRQIGDLKIPRDTGDFRLMDRRVIDIYNQFHEDPRFFRGLVTWVGFKQIGIPFVRRERFAGRTKYRYDRLLRLAFDTITAFSTTPALWITLLAGAVTAGSAGGFFVTVALWLTGFVAMEQWMWAAFGFLFLFDLQFLCIAVLGEYIVRTHKHTQRRPLFIVDSVIQKGKPQ